MKLKKFKSLGTGGLILAGALFTTSANAADGCKFVLCMGAVNPMGISECAGTVKEVLRDLAKGKSLPTCELVNADGGKSKSNSFVTAKRLRNPSCPIGYTKGNDGIFYVKGKPNDYNIRYGRVQHKFAGKGEAKNGWIARNRRNTKAEGLFSFGEYHSIACVAGKNYHSIKERLGDGSYRRYEFYEKLSREYSDPNKYEFTMYVEGEPYRKHRF